VYPTAGETMPYPTLLRFLDHSLHPICAEYPSWAPSIHWHLVQ
jgi:hypothetical protein